MNIFNLITSTDLDNLWCLQQTEFSGLACTLGRNPRAGRPGRTEKRAGGLAGGLNHQVHQPGSHYRCGEKPNMTLRYCLRKFDYIYYGPQSKL